MAEVLHSQTIVHWFYMLLVDSLSIRWTENLFPCFLRGQGFVGFNTWTIWRFWIVICYFNARLMQPGSQNDINCSKWKVILVLNKCNIICNREAYTIMYLDITNMKIVYIVHKHLRPSTKQGCINSSHLENFYITHLLEFILIASYYIWITLFIGHLI